MKRLNKVLRAPAKYHGGKTRLLNFIIPKLEYNPIFVDTCVGMGSISLNVDEVFEKHFCFDLDEQLINMWLSLQQEGNKVVEILSSVDYCEENFLFAKRNVPGPRYARAADMIIRSRFSRGGLGETFAWSDRTRGGLPGDLNSWQTFRSDVIGRIVERVQPMTFAHGCLRDLMERLGLVDVSKTVYCDVPYVSEARTAKDVYQHEMLTYEKDAWPGVLTHEGLLKFLKKNKGVSYLSGYDNFLYQTYLSNYPAYRYETCNNSSQSKKKAKRIEVLWEINGGY